MEPKICRMCHEIKSEVDFRKNCSYASGIDTLCKSCNAAQARLERLRRPFRYRARKYKTTETVIEALLTSQTVCQICNSTHRLVIDHDHNSGRIRGVLCDLCNKGLGSFKDNFELIQKASQYLERRYGQ